ncbi:MAG: hydrolase [Bacillota bacterium]|nr:hydrolase [Bacillota bacterium]
MEKKVLQLDRKETLLVLVDFQERLMPAMAGKDELEKAAVKLAKGCRILGLPVVTTQQYTKGLGPTVPLLQEALEDAYRPIEKTSFSCMGAPAFAEAIEAERRAGRCSIVLAGVETHVCVAQTALDLLDRGWNVFLAADCVASRKEEDKKYALRRMAGAGAVVTTCEAVLFELLKGAGEPGFREISALVK